MRAFVVEGLVGLGREVHTAASVRERLTGTRGDQHVVVFDGPQAMVTHAHELVPSSEVREHFAVLDPAQASGAILDLRIRSSLVADLYRHARPPTRTCLAG